MKCSSTILKSLDPAGFKFETQIRFQPDLNLKKIRPDPKSRIQYITSFNTLLKINRVIYVYLCGII